MIKISRKPSSYILYFGFVFLFVARLIENEFYLDYTTSINIIGIVLTIYIIIKSSIVPYLIIDDKRIRIYPLWSLSKQIIIKDIKNVEVKETIFFKYVEISTSQSKVKVNLSYLNDANEKKLNEIITTATN